MLNLCNPFSCVNFMLGVSLELYLSYSLIGLHIILQGQQLDPMILGMDDGLDSFDDKLPGSFDEGDPQTTNLYVGNLSPQV